MHRFPPPIVDGMRVSGAMTTCVPVQFDNGVWETAVFFALGGKHCKDDRQALRRAKAPLPITVEAEVIAHASASVVMLRFEVATQADNPLVGEVLLAPGAGGAQFDALKHLSAQQFMRWYFGDHAGRVIHAQQTALREPERQGYADLLQEAVSHDALLRLTGRYSAGGALREIAGHYAPRQ